MKNNNLKLIIVGIILTVTSFYLGSLRAENKLLKSNQLAGETIIPKPTTDSDNSALARLKNLPKVTSDDYIRGAENATIILVEYSDFECPFCQRFHSTMKQIIDEFSQEVAWVYRHYPLSFHANAQKAAEAAECVGGLAGQDAFWKFGDLYFEKTKSNGTGFPLSDLAALASEAGADMNDVQKCLDNDEMAQKVKDQFTSGQNAGVSGTPGTFVVTKEGTQELIPGALPYEQVKQIIKKYL